MCTAWNCVAFHGSSVFGSAVYPTTRVPPVPVELSVEPLEQPATSRPAAAMAARPRVNGEPSAVRSPSCCACGISAHLRECATELRVAASGSGARRGRGMAGAGAPLIRRRVSEQRWPQVKTCRRIVSLWQILPQCYRAVVSELEELL